MSDYVYVSVCFMCVCVCVRGKWGGWGTVVNLQKQVGCCCTPAIDWSLCFNFLFFFACCLQKMIFVCSNVEVSNSDRIMGA